MVTWNRWETEPERRVARQCVPDAHNIAFLDGHVSFIRVSRGLQVTPGYTIIPSKALLRYAPECQDTPIEIGRYRLIHGVNPRETMVLARVVVLSTRRRSKYGVVFMESFC